MGKAVFMPVEPQSQVVELPSRGIPYRWRDGKVSIRPMTAREEKLIATANENTYMSVIDRVIGNCLKEPQIDPEELTEGDRSFILLWLRINSYFPEYRVELDCAKCRRGFLTTVDLSSIPVKFLSENVSEPYEVLIGKHKIGLRFLRGRDEKNLTKLETELAQKGGDPSDRYIFRYALSIMLIDGEEVDLLTAKTFIESLTGRDLARLRKALKEMEHGVIFEKRIRCPLCGRESDFVIPITAEFFLPTEPDDGTDNGETLYCGETARDLIPGSGVDGGGREGVVDREGGTGS